MATRANPVAARARALRLASSFAESPRSRRADTRPWSAWPATWHRWPDALGPEAGTNQPGMSIYRERVRHNGRQTVKTRIETCGEAGLRVPRRDRPHANAETIMPFLNDVKFAAPLARAHQGAHGHGGAHPGPRHRRQRRHLQPGERGAAAAARQPRRGPAHLHPPDRARHRGRQHDLLRAGDPGPARARQDPPLVRRLLHHRLHHGRPRRAARGPRGRRGRILLRGDGAAPGAGPAARAGGRRPGRRGGGGADPSLLDDRRSTATPPCSARPSGSTRARPPSWACWSRRCPIPRTPRSSPTW